MRIWILIFSAALFAGGTCLGVALQPKIAPPTPQAKIEPVSTPSWGRHGHEFSVHRFASELDLSGEQDRELDAILSDSQDELQALGRAMRAAQEKSRERIVGILTPEQKSRLDELMAAERVKRSEAEIHRTVEAYRRILSLNDEQASAMRSALAEGRKQRRESWKSGADHHQVRRDAREKQNKALEKAFSTDQYKRYLEVSELERFDR